MSKVVKRVNRHIHKHICTLVILLLVQCVFATHIHAAPPTYEQVRPWVKLTYGLTDVADQVLDTALAKAPLPSARPYLDIFGYFLSAEQLVYDLYYKRDYYDAAQTALGLGFDWVISDTFMSQVLATPMSVADLATLPIQYSLDAFINQIQKDAWDNQVKLYIAARQAGMSELDILNGIDDNSRGIFFLNGWLFCVGDIRIPPLGLISPDGATKYQVYGYAQNVYNDVSSLAFYQRDKDNAGAEFKKILNPGISYSPTNSTAPSSITFTADPGTILSGMTITSYAWDFGDGLSDTGQSVNHYYRAPGTYNVSLTITDSNNGTHVVSESVTLRPPEIDVTYPDGYESLNRHFSTPNSSRFKGYSWDYGDNTPTEPGSTQDHPYSTTGNYTVTLTLTLNDDSSITSQIGIFVGPGTRTIQGHTIYGDETWYSGGIYVLQGDVFVAQGATLTIEQGAVIQFASLSCTWNSCAAAIIVNGTLNAKGAQFTSANGVNAYGGSIVFSGAGASKSKLDSCDLEHLGGIPWFDCLGWCEPVPVPVVFVDNSSPTIIGNTFVGSSAITTIVLERGAPVISNNNLNNGSTGIIVREAFPTVTGNVFAGNGTGLESHLGPSIYLGHIWDSSGGVYSGNRFLNNSVGISMESNLDPQISNNSYQGNIDADLSFSGTINNPATLNEPAAKIYRVHYLEINGGKLHIPSGRTVKFDTYGSIQVNSGEFIAEDTKFTAEDVNSSWSGINLGESNSRIDGCIFEHIADGSTAIVASNQSSIANNTITAGWSSGISAGGQSLITNNTITAGSGIHIYSGSPVIRDNNLNGLNGQNGSTGGIGLHIYGTAAPEVVSNAISGFFTGVYFDEFKGGGVYSGNVIKNNGYYGAYYSLYKSGYKAVDMSNNDWGDPSGPLDDSDDRASGGFYNPNGKGNKVSNYINYYPWTGTTIAAPAVPASLSGIPSMNSVNLKWTPGNGSSGGGFKVYYGTSSGTYFDSQIAGNVSKYKLNWLNNGTPYFIAVSAMNEIGAESAKSTEITETPLNKYPLIVSFSGDGHGSVSSTPGGIAGNVETYALFDPNTGVTLKGNASDFSLFKGWLGDFIASSGDCMLTMDSDKAVTAAFNEDKDHKTLIYGTSSYNPTLITAYGAASNGNVIQAWGTDFNENLNLNLSKTLILKGGFNQGYTAYGGYTTLHGTLTVGTGSLTLENLQIQ
jgi:parallel beta-helix repeat protein